MDSDLQSPSLSLGMEAVLFSSFLSFPLFSAACLVLGAGFSLFRVFGFNLAIACFGDWFEGGCGRFFRIAGCSWPNGLPISSENDLVLSKLLQAIKSLVGSISRLGAFISSKLLSSIKSPPSNFSPSKSPSSSSSSSSSFNPHPEFSLPCPNLFASVSLFNPSSFPIPNSKHYSSISRTSTSTSITSQYSSTKSRTSTSISASS